jgi:uncharacterized protein (DUF2141 family)
VKRVFGLLAIVAATLLRAQAQTQDVATLRVTVTGRKDNLGSVLIAVFDREENWPRGARAKQGKVELKAAGANGNAECSFSLPPGQYALAAIHDRNGNGLMDRNAIGLPLERYGFSRTPGFTFGAPAFRDVAINLPEHGTNIVIRLK